MRKSREFDNVLDECLERLLTRGETVEQCVRGYPNYADELKSLLETALAASQAVDIQPRPEFKERARYQFYSALQEMERKRSRSFFSWSWQPRWVAVVAIVLALMLASGGTVVAASGSMPDEPLYPVKLATEQVGLVLTPSALGKAELYAELADRRVVEIVRMADESKPEQLERTAQRLDAYLAKIAALSSAQEVRGNVAVAPSEVPAPQVLAVEKAPLVEEAPVPGEAVAVGKAPLAEEAPVPGEAVAVEKATLAEEAPVLGEAVAVEKATVAKEAPVPGEAVAVEVAPARVEQAETGKEANLTLDKRRAKLKAIVVSNASENSARLRALLKTVPESAKPALLRAIAISEAGYEKALEALD